MKIIFILPVMCLVGIHILQAQKTISGIVSEAGKNNPLPGATISVKSTTVGTNSGEDGLYRLQVPASGEILIFSYVGMITEEVEIGDREVINIALRQDTLSIDEVVITAIGIPREKKSLGYSVQDLSAGEITVVPHTNVVNSLTGKVAGVQVTSSSGSPGASAYITIRGAASLAANNQPLFVVDGVPVSNDASYPTTSGLVEVSSRIIDLNSEDIESISVLKGGAATALYGLRAANGAIIITTKKGTPTDGNNVNVSFSSSVTFDRVSKLPGRQTIYGQGLNGEWSSGNFASWGPRLDTSSYSKDPAIWTYPEYDVDGAIVSRNSPFATGGPVNVYDPYAFFQTGVSTNNVLSLSGGNNQSTYYNSISYTRINGVVPNSNWKRFNIKVGGETALSKKFKILGSITYMRTGGDRMQKGSNSSGIMLGILRTPPSFDNAAGYELPDGSQRNYRHGSGYDNPYWSVNKTLFRDDVNRMIGYAGFNWFATKWLSVYYKLGGDFHNAHYKNSFAVGSNEVPGGVVQVMSFNQMDINSDLILQMDHRFNDRWEAGLKLGHNMYESNMNRIVGIGFGLEAPEFYHLSNFSEVSTDEFISMVRRAGFFGELTVFWDQMVYLTLTGRNDWSTTLPKNNNSFFYPSASVGWIFTELDLIKNNKVLSFGKIRFSVAQIANDPGPYQTTTGFERTLITDTYSNGMLFPLLGQAGFTLSNTLGNPELEPEITTSWEIGTDLKFFNNRLALDFTYFNNYSDGLLLPLRLSGASGYNFINANVAGMSSKGFEVMLYGNPVQQGEWNWDFIFNFTKIKNIVEKIPDDIEKFNMVWGDPWLAAQEGYPYPSFFGYDWYRDTNGKVLINDDPASQNYGFPVGYNPDTVIFLGQVAPEWTLGWTNNIHWKNLSFSFLLEYKKGGKMFNGTRGSMYYFGTHEDQENREPGDEVVFEGVKESDGSLNDIKVVKGMNWYSQGQGSTFTGMGSPYVEDAGWIRLREISLSYRLGDKLLSNTFIKTLDIYVACKNLWLKTDYSGIDPETSLFDNRNGQGIDYYNMPGTKSYTVGLRVSL